MIALVTTRRHQPRRPSGRPFGFLTYKEPSS
jgi:hypothetical protein